MSVEAPAIEAKVLMLKATGLSEEQFFASPEGKLTRKEEKKFERLLEKRLKGFPLAYVVEEKEFWSLKLKTPAGVFIPRPETELLVEKVIELSSRGKRGRETIIDIATGSGNIAVALARELPRARIVATDISAKALKAARLNAQTHNAANIQFIQGNLYAPLRGLGLEKKVDFIVCNPPYVSPEEWDNLPSPIRHHEPRRALVPGRTGLEFIRRLIRGAPAYLKRGAFLIFEIGQEQASKALALFDDRWEGTESSNDLSGIPRLIWGRTIITY
jgi:release factor glutamine methyltransferase